jgi:predicted GIY-YIG superfamily endonuclease
VKSLIANLLASIKLFVTTGFRHKLGKTNMSADEYILQLPHTDIKSRGLLPEKSGIYYVLDDKFIIWYIGQAKNLRARWAGKSHHRFYQLQKQRKTNFIIYYELGAESQLDAMERQRIEQYNPQLNGTKVKAKKLHPTETLLRETLFSLAPYSFVLGVEPPRKEDLKLIEDSVNWQDEWRVQKAVLPLKVIHICINYKELQENLNGWLPSYRFLRKIFRKRPNFSDNWACKGDNKVEKYGIFILRRLLVNGFAIEAYLAREETVEHIQGYELTQLAGVNIRAVNETSLAALKNKCLLSVVGMSLLPDNQNYPRQEVCHRALKRLSPYKEELVKLLFNEAINISKVQIVPTESQPTENSDDSRSVRLTNLVAKKNYLKMLLIQRGIDLNCYQVNKYLERIPTDNNYVDNNYDRIMNIYVQSFMYGGLVKPGQYLAATVDRAFWLLLEPYLSDFAKTELNQGEGYVTKHYVSARKVLVPAMLTVTLNGKWKADIPFGSKDTMSYTEVANIIRGRLQECGIPQLKFSFKSESTH